MDNGLEGQRFSQLYSNSDLHSNSWKWIFWFLNLTCTWAKLSFEEKLEKQDFASFNQHQKLVFDFGIHKLAIFLKSIIALFRNKYLYTATAENHSDPCVRYTERVVMGSQASINFSKNPTAPNYISWYLPPPKCNCQQHTITDSFTLQL